eukprot:Nitzschia sp. Nitz4//scaffold38_size140716//110198//111094//NITZ4_003162-RA/size140716-augustus-gene-0.127-mRNA-1//1//CDS//3329550123//7661//frame0
MAEADDLENLLDEALDELDDDCDETPESSKPKEPSPAEPAKEVKAPKSKPKSPELEVDQFMSQMQAQIMKGMEGDGDSDDAVAENLAAILEGMAKTSIQDNGEDDADALLRAMEQEFGALDDFGSEELVDGMMSQLLSKDLMYEPMKDVADKFPEWLEANKSKLSASDYQKYEKQYESFKKVVKQYETNPDDFGSLMELMQEVQEYGQPPADIVNELAPGLELGEDGMPKVNPLDQMLGNGDDCCLM